MNIQSHSKNHPCILVLAENLLSNSYNIHCKSNHKLEYHRWGKYSVQGNKYHQTRNRLRRQYSLDTTDQSHESHYVFDTCPKIRHSEQRWPHFCPELCVVGHGTSALCDFFKIRPLNLHRNIDACCSWSRMFIIFCILLVSSTNQANK